MVADLNLLGSVGDMYCFSNTFSMLVVGVMPLLECRILKIHSFPHFSLTHFDILS